MTSFKHTSRPKINETTHRLTRSLRIEPLIAQELLQKEIKFPLYYLLLKRALTTLNTGRAQSK